MNYRTRTTEIQAIQLLSKSGMAAVWDDQPEWFVEAIQKNPESLNAISLCGNSVYLTGPNGKRNIIINDFIVRDSAGTLSIVKPATFSNLYEPKA